MWVSGFFSDALQQSGTGTLSGDHYRRTSHSSQTLSPINMKPLWEKSSSVFQFNMSSLRWTGVYLYLHITFLYILYTFKCFYPTHRLLSAMHSSLNYWFTLQTFTLNIYFPICYKLQYSSYPFVYLHSLLFCFTHLLFCV